MTDLTDDRLTEIAHDLNCGDNLDACCNRTEAKALIAELQRRRATPDVVLEVQAPAAKALHDYIRGGSVIDDRDDLLEYLYESRQSYINHGQFDTADMYRDYHAALSKLLAEIQTLRAAKAADKERVRTVVDAAAIRVLSALENYETHDEAAHAIADRAAERLSGVPGGLGETERCHLLSIRARLRGQGMPIWDAEMATLDRLLGVSK